MKDPSFWNQMGPQFLRDLVIKFLEKNLDHRLAHRLHARDWMQ